MRDRTAGVTDQKVRKDVGNGRTVSQWDSPSSKRDFWVEDGIVSLTHLSWLPLQSGSLPLTKGTILLIYTLDWKCSLALPLLSNLCFFIYLYLSRFCLFSFVANRSRVSLSMVRPNLVLPIMHNKSTTLASGFRSVKIQTLNILRRVQYSHKI